MANPTIPELRAALEAATADIERLAAMLALCEGVRTSDPREALALATESIALAEELHDERRTAEALLLAAAAHLDLGNYDEPLNQSERAAALYEKLGDRSGIPTIVSGSFPHAWRGNPRRSCSPIRRQLSRTPDNPRAANTVFSACVIRSGSPATNSTRQVVQRALPPQACS